MATELWEMGLIVLGSFVGAFAPILLKKGMALVKGIRLEYILKNYYIWSGLFVYGLSYLISIPALKGGELSVLYPLISLVYIWTSFLSVKYLDEKMNGMKWFGIAMIIVGVSFIGLGK